MFIFLYVINFFLLLGSGFFIYKNYELGYGLRTVINTFRFRMEMFGFQGSGVLLESLTIILTLLTYLLFAVSLIVSLIFVIKYFKKNLIKRPPVIISLVVFVFIFLTYFVIMNYSTCVTNGSNKFFQFCTRNWQDQVDQIFGLGPYSKQLELHIDFSQITWKTYTNNDYGFSFKYPSQFDVEVKKSFQSRNINGKNEIVRYEFIFTTGEMVNGYPDFSGFSINVEPTNGKIIVQVFGKDPIGEPLDSNYFYPIKQKGGADEAFIANGIMVYRIKDLFYWSTTFQNSRLLPDKSDDVNQFRGRIFDTITFK